MARKTKEEALKTRERLLDAALDVFSEKGFSQARLSDIAERIGMTRGALYWHFRNKGALFVALLKKIINREEQLVRAQVPRLETLDDLKAHFAAHACVLTTDEKCHKFFFFLTHQMEWSMPMRELAGNELEYLRRRPFDEVGLTLEKARQEGALREGVSVSKTADILVGLWIGLAMNHMRDFVHNDFEHVVEESFSIVLDSIAKPADQPDEDTPLESPISRAAF